LTDDRRGFLRRIRLRMRVAWVSATAQRFAPYLGLTLMVVFAADWLTSFQHGLALAAAVIGLSMVGLLLGAFSFRISDWDASRAAERGLRARDALTTALEFTNTEDDVHRIIQERANILAANARPSVAIPIRADRARLRQFALAAALAVLIGLLPPLGSSPALSSDIAAAIDAEAAQIEEIAEAVAEVDVETSDEIVAELERLATELRRAETLEDALRTIDEAETRLGEKVDRDFLSRKAAVQGLARDLALRPLADGAPLAAASQLEQLAEDLESLSEPELEALRDRLDDLAGSQAAGNPALSSQLAEAARALGEGNLAAAASSLHRAAEAQHSGLEGARGQQALNETQRALEGARARLSGAGRGQDEGQAAGQSQGPDRGQGQSQGRGQGGGPGQGSGQPSAGGASGAISGVAPGSGDAAGQGGQGTVGQGTGEQYGTDVDTTSIFSPLEEGSVSDLVQVGIDGGSADGQITGRAEAPTQAGPSVVPYAQVLPQYLNEAADALDVMQLPPAMRGIVQNYFDRLADEAR
jgi:hypothetical protein